MKIVISVASVIASAFSLDAQVAITRSIDPVRTLIAAFDRVNLVGLGERHWAREDSEFRLRLIRDPEFSLKVNDIVIEFGNPLYQTVLDRFVNGDDVPYAELSKVWQMITQRGNGVWDSPVYEGFIAAVRSVNAGLPSGRRLRVVAGDMPINHNVLPVTYRGTDRDAAAADAIRREVLDKNRKALVIIGSFHF